MVQESSNELKGKKAKKVARPEVNPVKKAKKVTRPEVNPVKKAKKVARPEVNPVTLE